MAGLKEIRELWTPRMLSVFRIVVALLYLQHPMAKFFAFLSRPETQAWWHQNTGYLPITLAAYELSRSQGFYDKNPGTDTAIKQMTLNPPTENSKGLRFGSFVQIRDVIEEELEQAFAGKKTAKEALDSAVKRGNDLLRVFEKANM